MKAAAQINRQRCLGFNRSKNLWHRRKPTSSALLFLRCWRASSSPSSKLKAATGIPFYWTPWHDDYEYKKMRIRAKRQPRVHAPIVYEWKDLPSEHYWSECHFSYFVLTWGFLGSARLHQNMENPKNTESIKPIIFHGNITYCYWINESGRRDGDECTSRILSDGIDLHYHRKYGQKSTVWRYYTPTGARVWFWDTNVYKLKTSDPSWFMKPSEYTAYFMAVSEDGTHSGECDSDTFTNPGDRSYAHTLFASQRGTKCECN